MLNKDARKPKSIDDEASAGDFVTSALIKWGYIVRIKQVGLKKKREPRYTVEPDVSSKEFEKEAMYIWAYTGSMRSAYIKGGLAIVALSFFLMMKIWPLWLKLLVYWASLCILLTFLIISIVRLVLYVLMWIVGFRDIWLLPNLNDEEVAISESFYPLMGRGYVKKKRRRRKKLPNLAEDVELSDDDTDGSPIIMTGGENSFRFGLINLVLVLVLGAIGCLLAGLFDPKNVPDWVVDANEMSKYMLYSPDDERPEVPDEVVKPAADDDDEEIEFIDADADAESLYDESHEDDQ